MSGKAIIAAGLHAGLAFWFQDVFVWYWRNCTSNEYYNFSLLFVGFWVCVHYFRGNKASSADRPRLGYTVGAAVWTAYIIWRGPYFAAVCLLVTSLLVVRWVSQSFSKRIDSIYSAIFFTLPFPFYTELLASLQVYTLHASLWICQLLGHALVHEGSLVFLKDGPVRIAAACSGFQSLIVLFALAGMLSYFSGLRVTGKFLTLAAGVLAALAFNTARVSAMFLIGQEWGIPTAMNFWHDISGWLFYLLSLGSLALAGYGLRRMRRFALT